MQYITANTTIEENESDIKIVSQIDEYTKYIYVQYSTYLIMISNITFSQLPAGISQAFALDPDFDYDNTELSSKVAESRLGRVPRVPRVPSSCWQDFDNWIQLMDESRCSKIGKRMKYDGSMNMLHSLLETVLIWPGQIQWWSM